MLPPQDALDREQLHFFIAGPGRGEGLAMALPRPSLGWIFVDGCKTRSGAYPLHEIWQTYRCRIEQDPVLGIVLTHPHDDHYAGMNELSAVLHVRFGQTRMVLGGDLPERDHGAGPRIGWTRVLNDHPDLPGSTMLKVPHHGSDGAMHPQLVGPGVAPNDAVWTLTPFQGGEERPLPRLRHGRGVDALLRSIPSVYLTALPAGWSSPTPLDAPVPIGALRSPEERVPRASGPRPFEALPKHLPTVPVSSPPCEPLDPIWLFALDRHGRCVERYRGASAVEITR